MMFEIFIMFIIIILFYLAGIMTALISSNYNIKKYGSLNPKSISPTKLRNLIINLREEGMIIDIDETKIVWGKI